MYIELPVHKNDTVLLYVYLVTFSEYFLLYLYIGKGREGKERGGEGRALLRAVSNLPISYMT